MSFGRFDPSEEHADSKLLYVWTIHVGHAWKIEDQDLQGSDSEEDLDNQMRTSNFCAAAAEGQNVIRSCTTFKALLISQKTSKLFRYHQ